MRAIEPVAQTLEAALQSRAHRVPRHAELAGDRLGEQAAPESQHHHGAERFLQLAHRGRDLLHRLRLHRDRRRVAADVDQRLRRRAVAPTRACCRAPPQEREVAQHRAQPGPGPPRPPSSPPPPRPASRRRPRRRPAGGERDREVPGPRRAAVLRWWRASLRTCGGRLPRAGRRTPGSAPGWPMPGELRIVSDDLGQVDGATGLRWPERGAASGRRRRVLVFAAGNGR